MTHDGTAIFKKTSDQKGRSSHDSKRRDGDSNPGGDFVANTL